MGRTRKPCPGCGEVCECRPAAEVCGGCKGLIEDGEKYRELSRKSGDKPYGIGAFPHISHAARDFKEDYHREFVNAITSLLDAIGGPLPKNAPWNCDQLFLGGERYCHETVMLQKSSAIALRDLLMRLASGDVSLNSFNEATISGQ